MTITHLMEVLGSVSFITFIGSLIAIPWLIARMPQDYFIRHRQQVEERHRQHPVMAVIIFSLRNIIGLLLLLSGIAMLVLPGQGVLTIVIGLSIMDFAGKQRLLDSLIRRPKMMRLLNWLRKKEKKPPFIF